MDVTVRTLQKENVPCIPWPHSSSHMFAVKALNEYIINRHWTSMLPISNSEMLEVDRKMFAKGMDHIFIFCGQIMHETKVENVNTCIFLIDCQRKIRMKVIQNVLSKQICWIKKKEVSVIGLQSGRIIWINSCRQMRR